MLAEDTHAFAAQKFASVDQGIYGHLTRRNLAALAKERGDLDEAERQWRAVLAECPADTEAIATPRGASRRVRYCGPSCAPGDARIVRRITKWPRTVRNSGPYILTRVTEEVC